MVAHSCSSFLKKEYKETFWCFLTTPQPAGGALAPRNFSGPFGGLLTPARSHRMEHARLQRGPSGLPSTPAPCFAEAFPSHRGGDCHPSGWGLCAAEKSCSALTFPLGSALHFRGTLTSKQSPPGCTEDRIKSKCSVNTQCFDPPPRQVAP